MKWEVVIGLEVHTQLTTQSKVFSGSSTAFGAEPNTQANAVDIALPGVLPVLNKGAVERAIKFGLSVGATINQVNIFDRKNYFYPDLPKGYQISQLAKPIVEFGSLKINVDGEEKTIRITRAHMEEDAGKSLHEDFHGMTGIDLNRAGTPLLEIVSEPDMRSSAEAVAYARALHNLVTWIGICDGNMQEGSFRVDANVSVRPVGQAEFGTRREIKNLNSFRFLQQAIDFEARWQIETLEDGGRVQQATVLFDPETGETRMMRSKEDAHDYRYFPDPDLLPVKIDDELIERMRSELPELPSAMLKRFVHEYAISLLDAQLLTQTKYHAWYFEETLRCIFNDPSTSPVVDQTTVKLAFGQDTARFINNDLIAALNKREIPLSNSPLTPLHSAHILVERAKDKISRKSATDLIYAILDEGITNVTAVKDLIEERNLRQESDLTMLEVVVDGVLATNQKSIEEFRAGKEKAFNALVGQVMKATKGKANPSQVTEILKNKLRS